MLCGCNQQEETKLFIIYGQSNGAGNYCDGDIDLTPVDGVELWDVNLKHSVAMADPTNYKGKACSSAWPEFSRVYRDLTGSDFAVVNVSIPGSGINDLIPSSDDGTMAMGWIKDAIDHYNPDSVSMIFIHGETDAKQRTDHYVYFEGVNKIINKIKSMTDNYKYTYMHRVGVKRKWREAEFWSSFVGLGHEQIEFTLLYDDVYPVSVNAPMFTFENGLMSKDRVHYTDKGYKLVGIDIAINIALLEFGLNSKEGIVSKSRLITDHLLSQY